MKSGPVRLIQEPELVRSRLTTGDYQDLRKFTVQPPFVGAIPFGNAKGVHESPLLYMVSMRKFRL
jgi:hypothetical protein